MDEKKKIVEGGSNSVSREAPAKVIIIIIILY